MSVEWEVKFLSLFSLTEMNRTKMSLSVTVFLLHEGSMWTNDGRDGGCKG